MRHHNTFFVVTGAFGLLLTVLASPKNRRAGRRVYWAGCLIATISAFFIAYPPDWKTGILLSLFVSGMTVFTAYAYTPHIKIRGKIYAFSVEDSQPDPSPDGVSPPRGGNRDYHPAPDAYAGLGLATAKKFWWLLLFIMAMCALGVAQYFHFVIISVITAGVFTVFYLGGYYAGKRWPLRREQSVGYGKHSRQQKND